MSSILENLTKKIAAVERILESARAEYNHNPQRGYLAGRCERYHAELKSLQAAYNKELEGN